MNIERLKEEYNKLDDIQQIEFMISYRDCITVALRKDLTYFFFKNKSGFICESLENHFELYGELGDSVGIGAMLDCLKIDHYFE